MLSELCRLMGNSEGVNLEEKDLNRTNGLVQDGPQFTFCRSA
jgi:hypothetical protein